MNYDYLIVGAGLFGSVFAHEMTKAGKTCLVIDRRDHIAGNIYTKEDRGIHVHEYGAHIFHTSNRKVWDYVQQFAQFNHYINCPVAVYKDELYNMPFNMNTFSKMWNIKTPAEAKALIEKQSADAYVEDPFDFSIIHGGIFCSSKSTILAPSETTNFPDFSSIPSTSGTFGAIAASPSHESNFPPSKL